MHHHTIVACMSFLLNNNCNIMNADCDGYSTIKTAWRPEYAGYMVEGIKFYIMCFYCLLGVGGMGFIKVY